MSQLIKRLRQVSESVAPSIGFKTSAASSARPMLLVVIVPESDVSKIAGMADIKADAVLVDCQDLKGGTTASKKMAGNFGDTPLGILPQSITIDDIKELTKAGGDFITFTPSETPAALLEEDMSRVISLRLPLDDSLIRAIDQMPIDAILVDLRGEGEIISVSHLIECQRLAISTRKPLMVATNQALDKRELQALWEAGVNGVAVEATKELQLDLQRLHQAIEAISRTPRKSKERGVMVPHLEE